MGRMRRQHIKSPHGPKSGGPIKPHSLTLHQRKKDLRSCTIRRLQKSKRLTSEDAVPAILNSGFQGELSLTQPKPAASAKGDSPLKHFYAKGAPENRSPSLFTCRTLRFRKERSLSDYFWTYRVVASPSLFRTA